MCVSVCTKGAMLTIRKCMLICVCHVSASCSPHTPLTCPTTSLLRSYQRAVRWIAISNSLNSVVFCCSYSYSLLLFPYSCSCSVHPPYPPQTFTVIWLQLLFRVIGIFFLFASFSIFVCNSVSLPICHNFFPFPTSALCNSAFHLIAGASSSWLFQSFHCIYFPNNATCYLLTFSTIKKSEK